MTKKFNIIVTLIILFGVCSVKGQNAFLQLAIQYQNEGNIEEAHRLALLSEGMLNSRSSTEEIIITKILIAQLLLQRGEYGIALNKSLEVDSIIGEDVDNISLGYFNAALLGEEYYRLKNYRKAIFYYNRLSDNEIILKSGVNPVILNIQRGLCEYSIQNPQKALEYFQSIYTQPIEETGLDIDTYLTLFIHSISCHLQLSNIIEANKLAQFVENTIDKDKVNPLVYSQFLNSKAGIEAASYHYLDACKLMNESMEVVEQNLNNSSIKDLIDEHYLMTLRQYIIVLTMVDETERAFQYYNKALKLCQDLNLNRSIIYLDLLHGLFRISYKNHDLDKSIDVFNEYVSTINDLDNLGLMDENYLGHNLSFLVDAFTYFGGEKNLYLGNHDDALKAANIAEIIKSTIYSLIGYFESNNLNTLSYRLALRQLCMDDLIQGEFEQGIELAELSMRRFLDSVYTGNEFLTKSDREKWLHMWRQNDTWFHFVKQSGNSELIGLFFNVSLATKCIEMELDNVFEIAPKEPEIQQLYNQFINLKTERFSICHSEEDRTRVDQTLNEFERRLLAVLPEYTTMIQELNLTYDTIQKRLDENSIVIDIIASEDIINTRNIDYYAMLLTKEGAPRIVKINYSHPYNEFPDEIERNNIKYDNFWGSLINYIEDKSIIYFSTDGVFNYVPVEILMDDTGLFANEKWTLYRITSPRILTKEKVNVEYSSATLFGGIDYEIDLQEKMSQLGEHFIFSQDTKRVLQNRGTVKYLEWSKIEVDSIASYLKNDNRVKVNLLTGESGSEQNFYSELYCKPSILHFATHGFYYRGDEDILLSTPERYAFMDITQENASNYSISYEDKALTRSGLLLSGANNVLAGRTTNIGNNDGILTAQEISMCDMKGIDLVVLSACDSGLGDFKSEGVYGLQRGFKKAGTNSILMSLWEVDDKATSILMQKFYETLLNRKCSKIESLKIAQKYVMNYSDEYSNPYYWAGWILLDALN